jgi:Uma2 family endonuclease
MTVAADKWTLEHYHQAVEAGIFAGHPVELLHGELVEMSPEGIPHAGLSSDGADLLRTLLGAQAKIREAKPITLPDHSEPEPDIAVVKPLGDVYITQRHPQVDDIFWVIEYSDSSLDKDLNLKTQTYAQAPIAEYWVINLKTRALMVFRDPVAGKYRSAITLTTGTINPLAFPAVSIAVAQLIRSTDRAED